MPDERERLATLEAEYHSIVAAISDRKREEERTRERLHKIEGTMGLLVDVQKQARQQEARQYRRLELRLQALTVVVALAGFALSLTLVLIHR